MDPNNRLEDIIFSVEGLFGYPSQLCQYQSAPTAYGYIQPHQPLEASGPCPETNHFNGHQDEPVAQQDQENPVKRRKRHKKQAANGDLMCEIRAKATKDTHNAIERRRRHRIRDCCDVLKTMVPGLSASTDKASVLEQTVRFVQHLYRCPEFKGCQCDNY